MPIELGSLNIPLTATGRDAVLQAFAEVERAGQKAGAAVTVTVQAPGAARAAESIGAIGQVTDRVVEKLRLMGVAEKDIAATLERSAPAIQRVVSATEGLVRARQAAATAVGSPASTSPQATQQLVAQQAAAQATTAAMRELRAAGALTFDRIARDATQATADYRAGIITLEDYQVALRVAREEATALRQASANLSTQQLASFNRVLAQTAEGAGSARREARGFATQWSNVGQVLSASSTTARGGINRVTSAAAQLAVQALGTRSAVGSLVTGGLISLGASAGVTLAVVAGAAAIGYAWDRVTKSARETREAMEKLHDELNKPTTQQAAALDVALTQKGVGLARQALAKAQQPTDVFDRGTGGIRQIPADPSKVAQAQADLDAKLRDLAKARAAAEAEDRRGTEASIGTLTKSIELRTASATQIRQAIGLLPILKRASDDDTKSVSEQNVAREQYNALVAAFKKVADEESDARKKLLQGMRDEAELLLTVASQRSLTAAETDRLRSVYERITEALKAKNLTDREQLDLLKEQARAQAELGRQTSATRTTRGSSFGQGTAETGFGIGRPKTPALEQITFGADEDKTGDFFAGGALDAFTEDLDASVKGAADRIGDAQATLQGRMEEFGDGLRLSAAESLAQGLAEGITAGFTTFFQTGSVEKGAAALTAGLLSAIGGAMVKFGEAGLVASTLMQQAMSALASLNPFAAAAAFVGLIAVGSLLQAAASSAFGGGSRGGGAAGAIAQPTTTRVTVGAGGAITNREEVAESRTAPAAAARGLAVPARAVSAVDRVAAPDATPRRLAPAAFTPAPRISPAVVRVILANQQPEAMRRTTPSVPVPSTAARQAAAIPAPQETHNHFVIIGPNDGSAQRQIVELINRAAQRGHFVKSRGER